MQHGTGSTDCNTVHRKLRYFTLTDDESFYHVFKRFLFVHQRFFNICASQLRVRCRSIRVRKLRIKAAFTFRQPGPSCQRTVQPSYPLSTFGRRAFAVDGRCFWITSTEASLIAVFTASDVY